MGNERPVANNGEINPLGSDGVSSYEKSGGEDTNERLAPLKAKLAAQIAELKDIVGILESGKGGWAAVERELNSPVMSEFSVTLARLALDDPTRKAKAASIKTAFFGFAGLVKKRDLPAAVSAAKGVVDQLEKFQF